MNNVIPSRLIVPIRLGRQILGVLDLIDGRQGSIGEVDLYTIWPIADRMGTALENARESRPPSTRRAAA